MVDDGPIDYARAYAALDTEPFPVQAFRWRKANPSFLRQEVAYGGRYAPGTIVVDPRARHLYLVQEGGGRAATASASAARASPGTAWRPSIPSRPGRTGTRPRR